MDDLLTRLTAAEVKQRSNRVQTEVKHEARQGYPQIKNHFLSTGWVGYKGHTGTLYFLLSKFSSFFLLFPPVHSSLLKMKLGKKKDSRPPDWLFFCPPGLQETIFYLRIDYGDGRVIRGSSTKMVISELWNVIFRHAIHH